MSRTVISSERMGYGRGLILGLTMAETMLLLVFCLLLAVGAIFAAKDREIKEAQQARESAELELASKEKQIVTLSGRLKEIMQTASHRVILDEEWRELHIAKDAADRIVAAGLTLEEAVDNAGLTKAAKASGLTPETVAEVVDAAKAAAEQGMLPKEVQRISASVAVLRDHGYDSPDKAAALASILEKAAAGPEDTEPHEWPPIINLSEAGGYTFNSGSAELTEGFKEKLRKRAPEIAEIARQYKVDVIEIIGHTDEQAMSGVSSNMDRGLKDVLDHREPITHLRPADNAGLGLARALSVAGLLKQMPDLAGITILPFSGGQMVLPGDIVTDGARLGDVRERRRIEIRVRKRVEPSPTEVLVDPSSMDAPSKGSRLLVPVAN